MINGPRMRFSRTPQRHGLHRHIVDEIGSRIVNGEFAPGAVLVEANLGEQFGISRSGVREAVKVLAAKGLVESRTKIGTMVRERDAWNMLDPDVVWWWSHTDDIKSFMRMVLDVRLIIEPGAAALAAERATDKSIRKLSAAYQAMLSHGGDPEKAVRADGDFHIAILEMTDNELLRSLAFLIEAMFIESFKHISKMPDALTRAIPLHKAVHDAIAARTPAKARQAMDVLVADAREYVLSAYRPRKAQNAPRPSRK